MKKNVSNLGLTLLSVMMISIVIVGLSNGYAFEPQVAAAQTKQFSTNSTNATTIIPNKQYDPSNTFDTEIYFNISLSAGTIYIIDCYDSVDSIDLYEDVTYNTVSKAGIVAFAPSETKVYYFTLSGSLYDFGIWSVTEKTDSDFKSGISFTPNIDTNDGYLYVTYSSFDGAALKAEIKPTEEFGSIVNEISFVSLVKSSGIALSSSEFTSTSFEYTSLNTQIDNHPEGGSLLLLKKNLGSMASESFKLVVAEPEAEPSWFAENWMTLLIVGIIGVVIVFILVILGAGAKAAIRAAKTPAEFHKMAEKSGALEEVQKAQQKLASKPAPIALPPPVAANELKNYKHIFFMSHALDDFTWVQKAAKEIESWPGCYCWYCERDLKPGQDWLEGIYDGLDVMDWYILFWSEKAKTSKWTNEEIREAKARNVASNGSKPKITIVNLGMSEWPKLISRSQGSMISSDADLENWLNNLKNQIGM